MSKVAVITGGGTGFGLAIARKFVGEGWRVLITGRREEVLLEAVREIGQLDAPGEIACLTGDMSDYAQAQAIAEQAVARWGRIDVWVNNAGAGVRIAPFDELSVTEVETILGSNLTTVLAGCRAVVPFMKQQQSGCIVNVSSACAKHAWPGWSVYTAAKSAIIGFSRCLYTELRPHGVRVGTFVPGAGQSEFAEAAGLKPVSGAKTLMPEDVADAVWLMASLPERVAVEELILWGMDQEVVPL